MNDEDIETFIQLIKTIDERSFSTEENTDIKYLVELPMTAAEYAFFAGMLKKIKVGTTIQ